MYEMTLLQMFSDLIHRVTQAHGTDLYAAVIGQKDNGAWVAFGRDTTGAHCFYIVVPLSDEQVNDLATRDTLLSEEGFLMARNRLSGRLS